ncbi:MAG: Gfo/Idh/MocA family oxidoreductase [Bacillota bacterium]|nr:Gfo/Idh/MocA family oxidoreductase [Bacillota bacterium]
MIQVGIIGMGMIGRAHLDALQRIPGVEVVAVASPNLEDLVKLQEGFGLRHVFADWRELVDCPDVEAVHNCTPNHLHHEINLACISRGKVIFSEKPLGMDVQETSEAAAKAKTSSIACGVNFCYRAYPMVQWAKQLIQEGYLGEIRAIYGHYLQDWLMYETDYDWRVDSKVGGFARAVGDIGSHWVDLARYLTGLEVEEVLADTSIFWPQRIEPTSGQPVPVDTEDWATALLRFNGGVKGNVVISQISGGHQNDLQIEIVGTKRTIRWRQEDPEILWIGERGGCNQIRYKDGSAMGAVAAKHASYPPGHPEGYPDCIKNTIANFYSHVLGQGGDFPTFEDGHRAMEVVTAIIHSAETERWTRVGGGL